MSNDFCLDLMAKLETAFKEAVDHYLDTCAELGEKPNKPYSGKLTLRIP
ncbi:MAG: toxin-antitoxin system HicB family antitoxin, partial [Proteobacteria bacterium]|nr:toxin-antitoxin system HicB family antitoxin [Pseudomonadota bacterium]